MKPLELEPSYRQYLNVKHALRLDDDGDECLVGLTASESVEYLAILNAASVEAKIHSGVDPERFLDLYDRHIAALPVERSIMDTSGPSIW